MSNKCCDLFTDTYDAAKKIQGCIVKYEDKPIYIYGIDELPSDKFQIKYYDLPAKTGSSNYKRLPGDVEFDYATMGSHLGYMNVNYQGHKQAIYLQRTAARMSVYGLSKGNLDLPPLTKCFSVTSGGVWKLGIETLTTGTDFLDMWFDKYPTIKQIKSYFEEGSEGTISFAFHKRFCIEKKSVGPFYLVYRNRDIGWSEDMKSFNLDKSYKHLSETLEYYEVPFK